MNNKLVYKRKEIETTILVLFILIFIYIISFPLVKFFKLKNEIKNLENEISVYKDKIEELKLKIEFIKSDEGIEKWIKENFKLTRDGEKIYIIKEKKVD
ncbi:MAG: septum formation initiator family protein [Caldisericia bacterium]|jgi:cell division protein FtsL|nr:septum formation initiator family protein [Caldisericia bacterium]